MPWTRSVRRRHNHCKSTAYKHNQRRQDAQMSSKSEAIERKIEMKKIRFRTLGCWPLTGAIESEADTIEKIVLNLLSVHTMLG